jgi:hypothetical protein
MKVVTELKDLDSFMGLNQNLKPSDIPAFAERVKGLIEARIMFIEKDGVFVAERKGGAVSALPLAVYLEPKDRLKQAREMKDAEIVAFVKAGGNFPA